MAHPDVSVSLWLFGDFDPDELSRQLGLTAWSKRPRRESDGQASWAISSDEHVQSELLASHLDWVLASVEPRAAELAQLISQDVDAHVNCDWHSVGASGGPVISVDAMTRLAALQLPLVISFYAVTDETDGG